MNREGTARRFAWIVWIVWIAGVVTGCQSFACADVGIFVFPPADTTVALGQSIVLTAAEGGRCIGGPVNFSTLAYWQAADSTIVSIAVLDSTSARISGRALGTTAVITSFSPAFAGTLTKTQVTVR